MAVALAGDGDLDHGEVGEVVVLVVAVVGRPPEDVEGEVRVWLGPERFGDVGWGEAGLELVDPCLELLLVRSSGSRVRVWILNSVVFGWWW